MVKTAFPTTIDQLHHNFSPENSSSSKSKEASVKEFEEGFRKYGQYPQNSMTFPYDLEKNDEYWVMFSPFEYSRDSRDKVAERTSATSGNEGTFKGHIILPLPADLATGYGTNYSQEELGVIGMGIAAMAEGAKDILNKLKKGNGGNKDVDVMKSVAEGLKEIPGKNWMDNAKGALASGSLAIDDFFTSGASIGLGIQRNPHLAVLFEGVGFRQHRFNYKFTAKNQKESLTLYSIIKAFKAAMLPSYPQGYANNLFKYPDEWDITFAHPQFKIGPSVLLDFQVNYHGQGVPSYFRDHQPTTITLSLLFQETSIVTKEDVLDRER